MAHQDLLEAAFEAISKLTSDTSVEKNITRDSLEELLEEIGIRIAALDE